MFLFERFYTALGTNFKSFHLRQIITLFLDSLFQENVILRLLGTGKFLTAVLRDK